MRPVARTAAWLAWLLAATPATADPQTVIEVAGPPAAGVFHHLGAAGRRALAVSDAQVAVAWEDDHGGAPHAYGAIKSDDAAAFGAPIRASTTAEAYEPALVYAGHGFFALAYEGDGQIRLQSVDARGVRASTPIGGTPARQATLAAGAGEVHVAWSEKRAGGAWNVRHASYTIGPDGELRVLRPAAWVNVQPVPADQSYPARPPGGPHPHRRQSSRARCRAVRAGARPQPLEPACRQLRQGLRGDAPRPGERGEPCAGGVAGQARPRRVRLRRVRRVQP